MRSPFPIAILNGTFFLLATVQIQVHNENPVRYVRNTVALVNMNTKVKLSVTPLLCLVTVFFRTGGLSVVARRGVGCRYMMHFGQFVKSAQLLISRCMCTLISVEGLRDVC